MANIQNNTRFEALYVVRVTCVNSFVYLVHCSLDMLVKQNASKYFKSVLIHVYMCQRVQLSQFLFIFVRGIGIFQTLHYQTGFDSLQTFLWQ